MLVAIVRGPPQLGLHIIDVSLQSMVKILVMTFESHMYIKAKGKPASSNFPRKRIEVGAVSPLAMYRWYKGIELRMSAPVLQVKGVLDKEEVLFAKNKGYLYGSHVVVGLPHCLVEASKEPHAVAVMQHTLAVAVDEVDACFLVSPCMLLIGSSAWWSLQQSLLTY